MSQDMNFFGQQNNLSTFESFCFALLEQKMVEGDFSDVGEIIGVMKEVEII